MIFIFSTLVGMIVLGAVESEPIIAWCLLSLVALLGGAWSAYDQRVNGDDDNDEWP
jgi:hypothetical protein